MPVDDHQRLLVLVLLVGALFGTFVWYGTVTYDPALDDYPSDKDVASNPVVAEIETDGETGKTEDLTWTVTLGT